MIDFKEMHFHGSQLSKTKIWIFCPSKTMEAMISGSLSYILLFPQQQEQDPTNLYISNLPVSMDEQELENMLKPFGHVISTRILRDANGLSRGVGFARCTDTDRYTHTIFRFLQQFQINVVFQNDVGVWWTNYCIITS